jgi:hypothetical protein
MTQAYPLQWPQSRPRTQNPRRAQFSKRVPGRQGWAEKKDLTVADAIDRLQEEVDRFGAEDYVLSTNLETKLNGLPRSGQAEPRDPGAALYFHLDGKPHCLPCDTYDRVADNIAAIAKHLEATRAIERYGVATLAEMFTGFQALPAPEGHGKRHWRDVLGLQARGYPSAPLVVTVAKIQAAFNRLAKERHPDRGGSDALMAELNIARKEALAEVSE